MGDRFAELCRELIESPLVVVDVGAAGVFRDLPRLAPLCVLHTFEPRPAVTQPSLSFREIHRHDCALASSAGERTLFVTATPKASSLLLPNTELARRWGQEKVFKVVDRIRVPCAALDDLNIGTVDYLKLDTQGSEFEVLRGATTTLASTLVIRA